MRIGGLQPALLEEGLEGLRERVPLAVGTPLSPMLGQITRDLGDVAGRLGPDRPFVAECVFLSCRFFGC